MVAQHLGPNDVLVDNELDPSFRYYVGLPPHYPSVTLPHVEGLQDEVLWSDRPAEVRGQAGIQNWRPDLARLPGDVATLIEQFDSLWLVRTPTSSWLDGDEAVRRELERNLWRGRQIHAGEAILTQYFTANGIRRQSLIRQPVTSGPAQLIGVACSINPERDGEVALAWLPLAQTPEPLTVFVHGLARGQLITQHDGWPARDRAPTTSWQVGKALVDVHPVPRLQEADTLEIGLYNAQTMLRELWQRDGEVTDVVQIPLLCSRATVG